MQNFFLAKTKNVEATLTKNKTYQILNSKVIKKKYGLITEITCCDVEKPGNNISTYLSGFFTQYFIEYFKDFKNLDFTKEPNLLASETFTYKGQKTSADGNEYSEIVFIKNNDKK